VAVLKEELHRKLQAARAALLSRLEDLGEYDLRPRLARPNWTIRRTDPQSASAGSPPVRAPVQPVPWRPKTMQNG
jgi:hypothetical protein